jgi:NADPH-dependent 2,4-dienoyl-CoA reductase/sulfur reductase-like enzyme
MPSYHYLIIGGGMTAAAAIAAIREVDRQGAIGLIGAEPHPPYNRPPLTKALWQGDALESIWRKLDGQGVRAHLGRTARSLDPAHKRVLDDQGTSYTYNKLLLATGCTPRQLPFGGEQILYLRTVDDYQKLRGLAGHGQRIAVIGGGFIGSELGASLSVSGTQAVMIFPEESIGSTLYPPELAKFLTGFYREQGIEVLAGTRVTGCEARDGKSVLTIRVDQPGGEREVLVDAVVAGIGAQANVELAEAAGLAVDDGIRVDDSLRTTAPDIYAAGDVASIYSPALRQWRRVEHADNANSMGGYAGVAMTGRMVRYDYLPFFYSDFFDFGYEAVGEVDSRLQMVTDWTTPCREGVVYYLREGRVRGVLFWNVWGQVDAARRLIASAGPFRPADLAGRLRS